MIARGFSASRAPAILKVGLSLIAALACFGAVENASAIDRDIVNTFGFEAPVFTTTFELSGQLEGQVNPVGFGQAVSPGQWERTKGPGQSTAVIQTAVPGPSGIGQSVQVDRIANSNDRWAVPVSGYPAYPIAPVGEDPQPHICISWDMLVEQAAGDPDNEVFGPLFGVEAYDDDANPVSLLGALWVDATTAEVLYQQPGTGFLTPISSVTFGTWNNFQIQLDYSTHEYSIFLNNALLGTFDFVDDANVLGGLNEFSDADIAAVAGADNAASIALTGTAFFDNFRVHEGACIPEPSTTILAILGLWACGGRCRHRIG